MSDNYLMPYQWHRLFYYCKSTFFCGMHFCLQYDSYSAYYASNMLDAFRHLLCSKLCQHNRPVPNHSHATELRFLHQSLGTFWHLGLSLASWNTQLKAWTPFDNCPDNFYAYTVEWHSRTGAWSLESSL